MENKKQRILVTGGSGLVGTAIKNVATFFPNTEFIYLSSKNADLRYEKELRAIISVNYPLHGIIHLAANVGGLYKNMEKPVQMLEDNLIMNTNILKIAHEMNIQNVLCFLSTCIFPDSPPKFPITTNMLHYGPPHPSNEGYAYAKRMLEVQCRAYQKQYNRRYFCVVPTNIYGPGDNYNIQNAHVIPALIHKCYIAKKNDEPFIIYGDGTAKRQFIYSDDIAMITLWAFNEYKNIGKPLIMCPPNSEVCIIDVVQNITKAMNFRGKVIYDNSKSNGQAKKTADTTDIENLDLNITWTSLELGISKAVESFIQDYESSNARI